MVVLGSGWPREHTWYRLYDPDWRPTTPLLEVPVTLTVQRGLNHDFIAQASRHGKRGGSRFDAWVTVEPVGSLRRVPSPVGALPDEKPRKGDMVFGSDRAWRGYRPRTRHVFEPILPEPPDGSRLFWLPDETGSICGMPGRVDYTSASFWSADAVTYVPIRLERVLPADTTRGLSSCEVRGRRMTVFAAREIVRRLYTIDLASQTLVSELMLDERFNPYEHEPLPDGSMVFGTRGRGLMVATDPSNAVFELRPAPISAPRYFTVVGGDIIILQHTGHRIDVSSNRGRTWRTVDLEGEHW